MRRLVALLVFLGVSAAALSASEFELQISPHSYITFDESYQSAEPRIQYAGGITTGFTVPVISPLSLTAHIGFSTVLPSGPHGQMMQKGFTSHFAGAGFDVALSEFGGMQIVAQAKQSSYHGTFTRFTHLTYTVIPYVYLTSNVNRIALSVPITYDQRRDVDHALSAGIGICLSYRLGGMPE